MSDKGEGCNVRPRIDVRVGSLACTRQEPPTAHAQTSGGLSDGLLVPCKGAGVLEGGEVGRAGEAVRNVRFSAMMALPRAKAL